MTFTLEHLEFYLLILMRVSGFIMTAPFFSYSSVPMRIRAAMSVGLVIDCWGCCVFTLLTWRDS